MVRDSTRGRSATPKVATNTPGSHVDPTGTVQPISPFDSPPINRHAEVYIAPFALDTALDDILHDHLSDEGDGGSPDHYEAEDEKEGPVHVK
jgi:hypothetical protein